MRDAARQHPEALQLLGVLHLPLQQLLGTLVAAPLQLRRGPGGEDPQERGCFRRGREEAAVDDDQEAPDLVLRIHERRADVGLGLQVLEQAEVREALLDPLGNDADLSGQGPLAGRPTEGVGPVLHGPAIQADRQGLHPLLAVHGDGLADEGAVRADGLGQVLDQVQEEGLAVGAGDTAGDVEDLGLHAAPLRQLPLEPDVEGADLAGGGVHLAPDGQGRQDGQGQSRQEAQARGDQPARQAGLHLGGQPAVESLAVARVRPSFALGEVGVQGLQQLGVVPLAGREVGLEGAEDHRGPLHLEARLLRVAEDVGGHAPIHLAGLHGPQDVLEAAVLHVGDFQVELRRELAEVLPIDIPAHQADAAVQHIQHRVDGRLGVRVEDAPDREGGLLAVVEVEGAGWRDGHAGVEVRLTGADALEALLESAWQEPQLPVFPGGDLAEHVRIEAPGGPVLAHGEGRGMGKDCDRHDPAGSGLQAHHAEQDHGADRQ